MAPFFGNLYENLAAASIRSAIGIIMLFTVFHMYEPELADFYSAEFH